ncbi:DUF1127 domain-containing protein [Pseudomonas sp. R2.Fl]|nr:DUF1127 domain-containing protein [Pseudomonas sp. R2.Fl]
MIAHLVAYLDTNQHLTTRQSRQGLFHRLWRWHSRRRAAEKLRELPDYLLKDIGISRGEIDAISRGEIIRHRRGGGTSGKRTPPRFF